MVVVQFCFLSWKWSFTPLTLSYLHISSFKFHAVTVTFLIHLLMIVIYLPPGALGDFLLHSFSLTFNSCPPKEGRKCLGPGLLSPSSVTITLPVLPNISYQYLFPTPSNFHPVFPSFVASYSLSSFHDSDSFSSLLLKLILSMILSSLPHLWIFSALYLVNPGINQIKRINYGLRKIHNSTWISSYTTLSCLNSYQMCFSKAKAGSFWARSSHKILIHSTMPISQNLFPFIGTLKTSYTLFPYSSFRHQQLVTNIPSFFSFKKHKHSIYN